MKRRNDCYECQDRYVGCHSNCEKYLAFQNELKEARKERMENARKTKMIKSYCRQARKNMKTRRASNKVK